MLYFCKNGMLPKLETFWMWNNQVSSLKPLAKLNNLTHLYLPNNNIVNLRPIASLKNLEVIIFDNNKISDISPLSPLNKLIAHIPHFGLSHKK